MHTRLRERSAGDSYSGRVLDVDRWPELRAPVLVLVLTGWVDAGGAGASAAQALAEQLGAGRVFARYDLSDLVDLQQTRPTVALVDGETREVSWPVIEFMAGRAGEQKQLESAPDLG